MCRVSAQLLKKIIKYNESHTLVLAATFEILFVAPIDTVVDSFSWLWPPKAHLVKDGYTRECFFIDFGTLLGLFGHLQLIICIPGYVFFIDLGSLPEPFGHLKLIIWYPLGT